MYLQYIIEDENGNQLDSSLCRFMLADKRGRWFGKGLGSITEFYLPLKKSFNAKQSQSLKIKIKHYLRTDDLKGIKDFGIIIEKGTIIL